MKDQPSPGPPSRDDDARDAPVAGDDLTALVNKRLTLNLLIQGAAQHAFLTAHHVVRDEIHELHDELVGLYDRFAAAAYINHWIGLDTLIVGRPGRFWGQIARSGHPFHRHAFLRKHGEELNRASRAYAYRRAKDKQVSRWPVVHSVQLIRVFNRIEREEREHQPDLQWLARETTRQTWGIAANRLDGELTREVAFGELHPGRNRLERLLRQCAAGYGGVLRVDGELRVVAKAFIWPLLVHELTKGTAELVCMHGLNTLNRATYVRVTEETDRLEYEPWMLQIGPELWRRFLAAIPRDRSMAHALMHVARLDPQPLEHLMFALVEDQAWAAELMQAMGSRGPT